MTCEICRSLDAMTAVLSQALNGSRPSQAAIDFLDQLMAEWEAESIARFLEVYEP